MICIRVRSKLFILSLNILSTTCSISRVSMKLFLNTNFQHWKCLSIYPVRLQVALTALEVLFIVPHYQQQTFIFFSYKAVVSVLLRRKIIKFSSVCPQRVDCVQYSSIENVLVDDVVKQRRGHFYTLFEIDNFW